MYVISLNTEILIFLLLHFPSFYSQFKLPFQKHKIHVLLYINPHSAMGFYPRIYHDAGWVFKNI